MSAPLPPSSVSPDGGGTTEVMRRDGYRSVPADTQAEALVASLGAAGVDRLWFVSGTEIAPLQEATVRNRALGLPAPRLMTSPHEQAALAAACGETAVTGEPAATAFHVDVGLLNAGGAIHNADRGRSPVVIMSGYPPTAETNSVAGARTSRIQWSQQIPDQGQIVRQYVRWDHRLTPYDNAGTIGMRAAQVAMSRPRGPTYLALPREALMARPVSSPVRFPGPDQLIAASAAHPDPALLDVVAGWLVEADAPVLSVSRSGAHPASVAPLVELAELVGAWVTTDLGFRTAFPATHPLHWGAVGSVPGPLDTDLLVGLDSLVPWLPRDTQGPVPTRVVRIGEDPTEHMVPVYEFPSDLAIAGDATVAVEMLLEAVRRRSRAADLARFAARRDVRVAEGRRRRDLTLAAAMASNTVGSVAPLRLSMHLGRLDPDTIIVHEAVETRLLDRDRPGTLFGVGGTSIGFAAPMAIGVKAATPDRDVVAVVGDGSWMFANPTVCTWMAGSLGCPVVVVVCNNAGYRTGTVELARTFPGGHAVRTGDFTGGVLAPSPNFAGEAEANGAHGRVVTDADDLDRTLAEAIAATRGGTPAVIDVRLPPHVPSRRPR